MTFRHQGSTLAALTSDAIKSRQNKALLGTNFVFAENEENPSFFPIKSGHPHS
jgi:hypothetical protein